LHDQATREHLLIDPRSIVLKYLNKPDEEREEKIEDSDVVQMFRRSFQNFVLIIRIYDNQSQYLTVSNNRIDDI